MIIDICGYFGTACLMIASIPQLLKVVKDGHGSGLSWLYLLFVWSGLVLMGIYVIFTSPTIQLLLSYGFQLIMFSILIYKKKFPKELMIH